MRLQIPFPPAFTIRPSLLDAVVYGYLSCILECPTPDEDLQRVVLGCGKLTQLVARIKRAYFFMPG